MAIVGRRALNSGNNNTNINNKSMKVCSFWQQNRCLKGSSCEFLHADNRILPEIRNQSAAAAAAEKRALPIRRVITIKRVSQPGDLQLGDQQQEKKPRISAAAAPPQPQRICKYWQDGRCKFGEKCIYWHPKENELQPVPKASSPIAGEAPTISTRKPTTPGRLNKPASEPTAQRSVSEKKEVLPSQELKKTEEEPAKQQVIQQPSGLKLLTTLKAHEQRVTGIALLVDSALLFTGSSDETVKAWNCDTGECLDTIRVEAGVSSIASASGWVFVAAGREIKAWNPKQNSRMVLSGATGDITALATGDGCLIAGTKQGTICGWSIGGDSQGRSFEASSVGVSALRVTRDRIYSGFVDGSIKLWDMRELRCLRTVHHSSGSPVTGLALVSGGSLVSSSDDGVIRSWGVESLEAGLGSEKLAGGVEVFEGFDAGEQPVLGCLYRDSVIKMMGLPALEEKGKIFAPGAGISRVVSSPETGLVFVGDDGGAVKIWRWIQN